jgi:hypothetical protein
MTPAPKITIVTHFYSDDPKCEGDYYSRDVEIDGTILESYADAYHAGSRSAKEFARGIAWALGLDEKEIAERDEADIAVA